MSSLINHSRYLNESDSTPTSDMLEDQYREVLDLFGSIDEATFAFRYAPGKWTIGQLLGHCSDTERIMAYRALCFSRGEMAELPPFDEDLYVRQAQFDRLNKEDLLREFDVVRQSTIHLYSCMTDEMKEKSGRFSGNEKTVEEIFRVIAGHMAHHIKVMKERYLPGL